MFGRIKKSLRLIFINCFVFFLMILIVEGTSSALSFIYKGFFEELISERKHTQYDKELGWINLPNLSIDNMYGPGKHFKTNAMYFRNTEEFKRPVPSGKVRIVCSGDSYTLGYGVDNKDVWCEKLKSKNTSLETINLGQGGYGVDQAYLWYLRNRDKLDHNILLLGFITYDFKRMESDKFVGYGKPFLTIENGEIVNKNEPVPTLAYSNLRYSKIIEAISRLNTTRVLIKIADKLGSKRNSPESSAQAAKDRQQNTKEVVRHILKNLKKINEKKNSTLALVHFPTEEDYTKDDSEMWREFLHAETLKQDILLIDLFEEFRKYPPLKVKDLYYQANGHYSEAGNMFAMEVIYKELLSNPETSRKLQ